MIRAERKNPREIGCTQLYAICRQSDKGHPRKGFKFHQPDDQPPAEAELGQVTTKDGSKTSIGHGVFVIGSSIPTSRSRHRRREIEEVSQILSISKTARVSRAKGR